jgi:hypothetical protein
LEYRDHFGLGPTGFPLILMMSRGGNVRRCANARK